LITVDLERREVRAGDRVFAFDVDARARDLLLHGRDEISDTLEAEMEIAAHEAARAASLPKLWPGRISALSAGAAGAGS